MKSKMPPETLELLKMYEEEWRFRQTTLWKRITQFTILNFFITTLPFTRKKFPWLEDLTDILGSALLFPIIGLIMALLTFCFYIAEANRLNTLHEAIMNIRLSYFPCCFCRDGLIFFPWQYTTNKHKGIISKILLRIARLVSWIISRLKIAPKDKILSEIPPKGWNFVELNMVVTVSSILLFFQIVLFIIVFLFFGIIPFLSFIYNAICNIVNNANVFSPHFTVQFIKDFIGVGLTMYF